VRISLVALVTASVVCVSWTGESAAQYRWQSYTDASSVNEIVVRDGLVYMATGGGLVIYDPSRGTFDQYDNSNGLPSNSLTSLAFAADGSIYLASEDIGVAKVRVQNGRVTLLRSLSQQIDGLSSNRVNSIRAWGNDLIYGASPGAGTIRNDFASARYFERDGLPSDEVNDVLPVGDQAIMATAGGIAVLDRFGIIRRPLGGPASSSVLAWDGSRLIVGTDAGVWRLDPADSSWTNIGLGTLPISALSWSGSELWAGSTRNYHRYSGAGSAWTTFVADSLLLPYQFNGGAGVHRMRGLAADGSQVYLGGLSPGDQRGSSLMIFDGARLVNLVANTPAANDILRLTQDIDGSVWMSYRSFWVGKLMPNGVWVNYNSSQRLLPSQLPTNKFTNLALLADRDGRKWFCTLSSPTSPRPLDTLDDQRDADFANDVWTRTLAGEGGGDGLGSLRLQNALEDPAGNRWFMSDDAFVSNGWWGIQILSRDRSEWLQMNPAVDSRMLSGNVTDVAFNNESAFVAIKASGVQEWFHQGYDWNTLSSPSGDFWQTRAARLVDMTSDSDVSSLALRSDGVLWIGTADGLYRYQRGTAVSRVPVYTGFGVGILSPSVLDLALDHDENLWVASDLGLNRIARDDESDIDAFTTAAGYLQVAALRYPLDIITPLSNASCQALLMDREKDLLYVGTVGGLTILDLSGSGGSGGSLSNVYVFPNPVYGRKGHDAVKIENINGPVTIEVFDIEGELVHSQTADTPGQVIWDLTTNSGFVVGSGKYLIRISSAAGAVIRPVAVLR
jgi:ligand-binding sensor domain-containing protein